VSCASRVRLGCVLPAGGRHLFCDPGPSAGRAEGCQQRCSSTNTSTNTSACCSKTQRQERKQAGRKVNRTSQAASQAGTQSQHALLACLCCPASILDAPVRCLRGERHNWQFSMRLTLALCIVKEQHFRYGTVYCAWLCWCGSAAFCLLPRSLRSTSACLLPKRLAPQLEGAPETHRLEGRHKATKTS
jgi:hypothetical protein